MDRKQWQDSLRDSAIFPAYTDYLFGVDSRPEALEAPGLHPLSSHDPLIYRPFPPHEFSHSIMSLAVPATTPSSFEGYEAVQIPLSSICTRLASTPEKLIPRQPNQQSSPHQSQTQTHASQPKLKSSPLPVSNANTSPLPHTTPTPPQIPPQTPLLQPAQVWHQDYAFLTQEARDELATTLQNNWLLLANTSVPNDQRIHAQFLITHISQYFHTKKTEHFKALESKIDENMPGLWRALNGIRSLDDADPRKNKAEDWLRRFNIWVASMRMGDYVKKRLMEIEAAEPEGLSPLSVLEVKKGEREDGIEMGGDDGRK